MLSLATLDMLDTIARSGSFSAAAAALGKVPSALSYSVRKLEEELDVLVFDRRGQRAVLTPAGELLLTEGRRLLDDADALTCRVKRAASGWESEFRIALDGLVRFDVVAALLKRFYAETETRMPNGVGAKSKSAPRTSSTRISLVREVLGGVWEALAEGRADLAIGAIAGEATSGSLFGARVERLAHAPLGPVEFVFAVARVHPLAQAAEPLDEATIRAHRAVAVADSARGLARRSIGLLSGQEVLTVGSMADKIAAQKLALGCGYLPRGLISEELAEGTLIEKRTRIPRQSPELTYAWQRDQPGRALSWWLAALAEPRTQRALLP